MSRSAAAAQPSRRPQPQPRPRPQVVARQRRRRRPRLRLGLAIIPLIATLFAGVVYVNSAELRVTKRQGQVARQTVAVQEQIAQLNATLAKRDVQVHAKADALGLILPTSEQLQFLDVRPVTR